QQEEYSHALEFYLNRPLILVDENGKGNLPQKPFLLYVSADGAKRLTQKGWKLKFVKSFDDYLVTRLKGKFLNQETRKTVLGEMDLVLVEDN
ncbi:MAG: hypothetical protein ACRYFL_01480, partial [Janthinobacterium lividum]